ncbi:hypothetical protein [Roseomonas marmotae]|uniref:Uncharacterized protein n=1 Tax=Roseomonas marmotae TaxID=2768161 RepID=A0ABS3K8C8_9PROT|nr:hypothetical protein [Roseomonas marmotae]MBO1073723.1 hypothetical protein [Roseomonas marmotae]QTI78642.1 hypothetical protein IAI58_13330 [Roseomonas marmotae]
MPSDVDIKEWIVRWGYNPLPEHSPVPRSVRSVRSAAGDLQGVDTPQHADATLAKPLARSIADRMRNRWAIDRTATFDQISGVATSRARQKELASIAGDKHPLVITYGLRTITDLTPAADRAGIRIDSDFSSPYSRDELDLHDKKDKPVETAFRKVYEKYKGPELPEYDENRVFFVNSGRVLDKLTAVGGADWTAPDGTKVLGDDHKASCHFVREGFHALIIDPPFGRKEENRRKALSGNLLPGTGATPSTYKIVRLLFPEGSDPLEDTRLRDEDADTDAQSKALAASENLTRLEALPRDHPMETIAGAAAKMVRGLERALDSVSPERAEKCRHNRLIAAALKQIEQLMATMPSYMDDIPRFSRLFDLLVDEVYLALAVAKPYTLASYQAAAAGALARRAPTLNTLEEEGVTVDTFLLSSGMDTMASATLAAKAALGDRGGKVNLMESMTKANRKKRGANYFEVQTNMFGEDAIDSVGPLIMGTLNPSTPTQQMTPGAKQEWDVQALIDGINARLDAPPLPATPENPSIAIIDITVEKGAEQEAELEQIIKAFDEKLAEGSLQIVLCKSYQKFPSLGSGKAMAGGVSLIGKAGPTRDGLATSLKETQDAEKVMDGDEAQLVVHFVTHEDEMERPMLARAAKNADFVRKILGDLGGERFLYAEGLPFLAIPDDQIQFGSPAGKIEPGTLLQDMGLENRFSFGFQNSSCLPFPKGVRIAVGQESEAELTEKFFAPLRLIGEHARSPTLVTPERLAEIAGDAATMACRELADRLRAVDRTDPKAEARWRIDIVAKLLAAGAISRDQVEYEPGMFDDKAKIGLDEGAPVAGDVRRVLTEDNPNAINDLLLSLLDSLGNGSLPPGFDLPADKRLGVQLALVTRYTGALVDDGLRLDDVAARRKAAEAGTPLVAETDSNLLHANIQRGWRTERAIGVAPQGMEASKLPNIVASCALTSARLFKHDEGMKSFATLADLLIENGLDQLSPEAQQGILRQRAEAALQLDCQNTTDTDAIDAAVATIKRSVGKLPYREGAAAILKGPAIAEVVNGWGDSPKESDTLALNRIMEAIAARLDLQARVDLLMTLLDSVEAQKKLPELQIDIEKCEVSIKESTKIKKEYKKAKDEYTVDDNGEKIRVSEEYGNARKELKLLMKEAKPSDAEGSERHRAKIAEANKIVEDLKTLMAHMKAEENYRAIIDVIEQADGRIKEKESRIEALKAEQDAITSLRAPPTILVRALKDALEAALEAAGKEPTLASAGPLAATRLGRVTGDTGGPAAMTKEELEAIRASFDMAKARIAALSP